MADTKTEDEDDEAFGDFTFAPFSFNSNPISRSISDQINGLKSTTNVTKAVDNEEDDEWGDFVEHVVRSNGSSGIQSSFHPSESANSLDPFGFFPDHSVKASQPVQNRVDTVTTNQEENQQSRVQWVKPKGALLLSMFEDEEVEEKEESESGDPQVGNGKEAFGGGYVVANGKTESNVTKGIGFDDIIANLYNQNQQIKDESKPNSNSSESKLNSISPVSNLNSHFANGRKSSDIVAHLHENGFNLHSNGIDSNMKASNSRITGMSLDFVELNSNPNGYPSDSNNQSLNLDGLNLDLNASQSSSNARNLSSNEQSWSFGGFSSNYSKNISGSNELGLNKEARSNFDGLYLHFNSSALDAGVNTESTYIGGINLDFKESNSNLQRVDGSKLDADDDDDDGWVFKDAYSEKKVGDINDKVDGSGHEISGVSTYSSGFGYHSNGSIDLFASSSQFSSTSHESNFGFDAKSDSIVQQTPISSSYFRNEWQDTEKMTNLQPLDSFADFDESFENFESTSSGNETKQKEAKVSSPFQSEAVEPKFAGKSQGSETESENHRGALPLSIFGDEELEAEDSMNFQDVSMFQPTPYSQNLHSQCSSISINDLISNLYSQAEQSSHATFAQKTNENGLDPVDSELEPALINKDDDFDDSSWEFKDAVSRTKTENQITVISNGEANKNLPSKSELNSYVEYYSKLKDKLCFVVICHLDGLKKAQSDADFSGDDMNVAVLDEDIQKFCKELQQDNIVFEEDQLVESSSRDISLSEFVEVLTGERFQLLEAEYHLSRSLALAEKDFRSAVDLIKHATTMLRIINLGSAEEQSKYVSTWSKMISVCAQELKHGAWIWKQSSEKNSQGQMLSERQGKRFVLALGEIYRVVLILKASVKLYKPWILSSSGDSTNISSLLEECHAHWSNSGLEEALSSIADAKDSEYEMCVKMLMHSIKYICDLDALTLENLVFNQQESICKLSNLTEGVVPGMKMAVWNKEHYFLTLANLWANLISCDPPDLPRLLAVS